MGVVHGHEPGFVGNRIIVSGSVFTIPPPADILAALRRICGSGGTLMIATNYTGDRLNLGLAAEQAKAVGYKVDMVMVGEDCITQHCGSCWTVWDNTGT